MARSIKLKNNDYIDSTGIVHNRELLSTLLNKVKKVGKSVVASYSNSLHYSTDIAPIPIGAYIVMDDSNPYISVDNSTHLIHIGPNVKYVRVTYNIRVDWDAPINTTYYFCLTRNGGIDWGSHCAIPKEYQSQYLQSFSTIYVVNENDYIQLCGYSSINVDANTSCNLIVEVLG